VLSMKESTFLEKWRNKTIHWSGNVLLQE
jgi:hypothetical protein